MFTPAQLRTPLDERDAGSADSLVVVRPSMNSNSTVGLGGHPKSVEFRPRHRCGGYNLEFVFDALIALVFRAPSDTLGAGQDGQVSPQP